MKRYPVFAAVALLFLLIVLIGSWVYVNSYPWPPFSDGDGSSSDGKSSQTRPRDRSAKEPFDDTCGGIEDNSAGGDGGGDTIRPGPLETPDPTTRRNPPEPVEIADPAAPKPVEKEEKKEEVVVEFASGQTGVVDGANDDKSLDPFIVSTLRHPLEREQQSYMFSQSKLDTAKAQELKAGDRIADAGVSLSEHFLEGEVTWPEMDKETSNELSAVNRLQAVVYLEKLPEFRAIVWEVNPKFRLPLTKKLADEYRAKGLVVVVHSPAFEIEGGFESVTVQNNDKPVVVALQLAKPIQVTVEVGPAEAVKGAVRVWLERRSGTKSPDHDDSLYMSAWVPKSGRLVFSVPEHYGELRVAATGMQWHSGLAQVVSLRKWNTGKVAVKLEMVADMCDQVGGVVKTEGNLLPGTRLESTHYGTTVYTGSDGRFSMYVPFDSHAGRRQMHVYAPWLRPEVMALEDGATSTLGVTGEALDRSAEIDLAQHMTVKLAIPAEVLRLLHFTIDDVYFQASDFAQAGGCEVKLPWGHQVLTCQQLEDGRTNEQEPPVTLYIKAKAWEEAFLLYASGKEVCVSAPLLTNEFEKR